MQFAQFYIVFIISFHTRLVDNQNKLSLFNTPGIS